MVVVIKVAIVGKVVVVIVIVLLVVVVVVVVVVSQSVAVPCRTRRWILWSSILPYW